MKKLSFLLLLAFMASCRVYNPSVMFKLSKDYPIAKDTASAKVVEYKISPYDQLEMHIYTNDGFKLVDVTGTGGGSAGGGSIRYNVENDGAAKLPLLGKVPLAGLTVREAEKF